MQNFWIWELMGAGVKSAKFRIADLDLPFTVQLFYTGLR